MYVYVQCIDFIIVIIPSNVITWLTETFDVLLPSFPLRAKYHKLKYGTELNQGEMKMPSFESGLFVLLFLSPSTNTTVSALNCIMQPCILFEHVPFVQKQTIKSAVSSGVTGTVVTGTR